MPRLAPRARVLEDELAEEAVEVVGADQVGGDGREPRVGHERVELGPAGEQEDLREQILGVWSFAHVGLLLGEDERVADVLVGGRAAREVDDALEHREPHRGLGEARDAEDAVALPGLALRVTQFSTRGHGMHDRATGVGLIVVEVDARRFGMADARVTLAWDDPVRIELLLAVRGGDLEVIRRLLTEHPGLATAHLAGRRGGSSTALHLVTDWPGYFPNGPAIVRVLADAGADPNALTTGGNSPTPGPGSETPLHYAASSDDVEVAEALIDVGADLDTPNGSIGTPLENAVGYGCWHVARLLVARGARVDKAWVAAAMGIGGRLDELLGPQPEPQDVSQAFWHACGAGQRRTAEYLLGRGADLAWEPDYAQGTALDAATGTSTRQENVITWLRELGAPSTMTD
jgi:uncharacterized protein